MIGADECPKCESGNVVEFRRLNRLPAKSPDILRNFCMDCQIMWESFSPADLTDPTDPCSTFNAMCDNCAFRKDSPERKNAQEWDALMMRLHYNEASFFCHKGVPMEPERGKNAFAYPKGHDGEYEPNLSLIHI